MRDNFTGTQSHKIDGTLNDWMLKIRRANIDGVDAFTMFKQGIASKRDLCEAIAKELI